MPALWISHSTVHDADRFGQYAAIAKEAIEAHGGHFIARGGRYKQCEGQDRARNVVAKFPTYEDAVACYESARYKEALEFARDSCEREVVLVETTE